MKKLLSRRVTGLLALFIALGVINLSIFQKEQQLAHGAVVYLELAPVDPRSLMQGDYMALRFAIGDKIRLARNNKDSSLLATKTTENYVIVSRDGQNRAQFKALYEGQKLDADDLLLRYRTLGDSVRFATNAFFFQEGHAEIYETAKYGQFRVNEHGEPLLAAMYDGSLKRIEPVPESAVEK